VTAFRSYSVELADGGVAWSSPVTAEKRGGGVGGVGVVTQSYTTHSTVAAVLDQGTTGGEKRIVNRVVNDTSDIAVLLFKL
jgi:hypothetical protein